VEAGGLGYGLFLERNQASPRTLREARPFRRQRSGFLLQRTTAALTESMVFGIDSSIGDGERRRNGGQDAR
jgi:hypothetical protein